MVDLRIRDEGSIVALTPETSEARTWIDDNVVSEGWQWLGGTLCIDWRYAPVLIQAALDAGLEVSA